MSTLRLFRQDDFTGGLNLRADQFQLGQNESPRLLNVEIDPRGGVFSRGGMRRMNTTFAGTWNPKDLFHWEGPTDYLMLTTGFSVSAGKVFQSTGSNFTDTLIPVSNPYGAYFAPWGDVLYVSTGRGYQCYSWNGTTATAIMASTSGSFGVPVNQMPTANLITSHTGKVFVANTQEDGADYKNRIRWSNENSPLRWDAADYIDVNEGGSEILGIVPFGGQLVILKSDAIFVLYGYNSDTFGITEITRKVGVVNPRAYAVSERALYFFSWPEGLFAYTGEGIVDLFQPIRPIMSGTRVNQGAASKIDVSYVNRRVWVSLPYSETEVATVNKRVFIYDPSLNKRGDGESFSTDEAFTSTGCWTQFATADGYGVTCGTTYKSTNGSIFHAVAHPEAACVANVDQYNQQTDNFTGVELNFETYYRTRWIDGGNYAQKKMFRRPDFVLKQVPTSRDLTVRVYHDYEEAVGSEQRIFTINLPAAGGGAVWGAPPTGSMTWGTSEWGAPNEGAFMENGSNLGLAKSVQMEFVGPTGKSWGLDSFVLKYNPRRVKA